MQDSVYCIGNYTVYTSLCSYNIYSYFGYTCLSLCRIHTVGTVMYMLPSRVESGSDDPDYLGHLGHFFGGSSGSHPQTKLSGCDPDF